MRATLTYLPIKPAVPQSSAKDSRYQRQLWALLVIGAALRWYQSTAGTTTVEKLDGISGPGKTYPLPFPASSFPCSFCYCSTIVSPIPFLTLFL